MKEEKMELSDWSFVFYEPLCVPSLPGRQSLAERS